MRTKKIIPSENARHPFERRGLGTPPYTFKGQTEEIFKPHPDCPAKPGASCDFCGTGIMDVYWFKSANGNTFKVGCDCLVKASKEAEDFPLQTLAAKLRRDHNANVRHERESIKKNELNDILVSHSEEIKRMPHPMDWRAKQGFTLLDYSEWIIKNAGNSGKISLLRKIKKELALS